MDKPKSPEGYCLTPVEWLTEKVNNGEGLTCLAIVNCAKGAIGSNYQLDNVEESPALARMNGRVVTQKKRPTHWVGRF